MLLVLSCQPIRPADYAGEPAPKPKGTIVLDLGRRYAVVIDGAGVTAREAADPSAGSVATYGFAAVVSTTAEGSGVDGKTWRRVANRGWAPRDGLLVFETIGDASRLATELRVFAPRDLRRIVQQRDRPRGPSTPTPVAAATPNTPGKPAKPAPPTPTPRPPTATPTPNRTALPVSQGVAEPLYGVVRRPETRLFEVAGAQLSARPPLEPGAVVAAVDEAVGADGQRALKLDSNLWLAADRVSLHGSAAEAAAVAYEVTMEWLAPGVEVHEDIAPALWVLQREAETRYLAEVVRDARVPIRVEKLPEGALAVYSFRDRAITVSEGAVTIDVRALAAYLAHEATHAWEHRQGLTLTAGATAACFEAELRAFRSQARLWEIFHGPQGKSEPGSDAERELNEIQQLLKQDPEQLKLRMVRRYGDQCGYHGPLPDETAPPATTPGAKPGVAPATTKPATTKPAGPLKPVASPKPKAATP
jgi:hypothetical protein